MLHKIQRENSDTKYLRFKRFDTTPMSRFQAKLHSSSSGGEAAWPGQGACVWVRGAGSLGLSLGSVDVRVPDLSSYQEVYIVKFQPKRFHSGFRDGTINQCSSVLFI